jgi:DNA-binding transcriptional MerR regulator
MRCFSEIKYYGEKAKEIFTMTIAEVSKKYEISADTLRYYERIGLIPSVRRKENGIRDYSDTDCGWVEFIKCMRGAGIQVEALIEYVSLFQQGDGTQEARKQILLEQREQLAARMEDMKQTLARLDKKIAHYDECLRFAENKLRGGRE